MTVAASTDPPSLPMLLRRLKLPSFVSSYTEVARKAQSEGWTFEQYLQHLAELELSEREIRRKERNLKRSGLPPDKTLATLNVKKLPRKVQTQIPALCRGDFVERSENLLAFGLPGRGKSHLVSAIGHELVARGYRVLFQPASSELPPGGSVVLGSSSPPGSHSFGFFLPRGFSGCGFSSLFLSLASSARKLGPVSSRIVEW